MAAPILLAPLLAVGNILIKASPSAIQKLASKNIGRIIKEPTKDQLKKAHTKGSAEAKEAMLKLLKKQNRVKSIKTDSFLKGVLGAATVQQFLNLAEPRGKRDAAEREMKQRKKGGKFPQATDKPTGKAALYKATPKRKPERKSPALGKAKKVGEHSLPPLNTRNPVTVKSGTIVKDRKKKAGGGTVYRKRNYAYGGRVAKYNKD
jgi:hypothetical protein